MATKLVTNNFRHNSSDALLNQFANDTSNAFYVFVGDHYDHSNNELLTVYDRPKDINYNAYRNMIFGKKVEQSDVKLMIRNIPYVSNTKYDMYDDQDLTLSTKDFYVVVNATSNYHVFKCLDNNSNTYSTVEPDFSHISGSNTYLYQTSDGYRWKYMYTVDSANNLKFSNENYFPVIANNDVSGNSVSGAIDVIVVDGQGKGYDNYTTGTYDASSIRVGGSTITYGIVNNTASAVNGHYTGCLLYISSGTGSGQYKTITNSFANDSGKYVTLESAFSTNPTNGSEFEIYPTVNVVGDGMQTVNVVARGLVNSLSSNSIYRVEIFNRGKDYTYATANVIANSVVGVDSLAIVRPILPPKNGHGNNAAKELYGKHISLSVKVSNNESNTISIDNQFQQIGLIKNPMWANVSVQIQSNNDTFTTGEKVYKITPVKVDANATINATSVSLSSNSGDYVNQFSVGDWVYLKGSNGTVEQIATVVSITNSSVMNLSSNGYWACTDTIVYHANVSTTGYVLSSNATHINLSNVTSSFITDDVFIGLNSGAKCVVNNTVISGETKGFDTFVQMYKYIGTQDSGTFAENEIIYQGNLTTSNAFLHSSNIDTGTLTVYTSNQVGQFIADGANVVFGQNSGATASFNTKYNPELVFGSGDVLFIENVEPISRSANTNETFQLIFEY